MANGLEEEQFRELFPDQLYNVAACSIVEDFDNGLIHFDLVSRNRDIGFYGQVNLPTPVQLWLTDHYYRSYGPYRRCWVTNDDISQHIGLEEVDFSDFNRWTNGGALQVVANFTKDRVFYQDMFAFHIYPTELDALL